MRLISWVTLNADVGIARSGLSRLADYATGRRVAALNGPARVERADLLDRPEQLRRPVRDVRGPRPPRSDEVLQWTRGRGDDGTITPDFTGVSREVCVGLMVDLPLTGVV